jgi:hypothetical protein
LVVIVSVAAVGLVPLTVAEAGLSEQVMFAVVEDGVHARLTVPLKLFSADKLKAVVPDWPAAVMVTLAGLAETV